MIGYGTRLIRRRQQRNSDGDRVGPLVDVVFDGWEIAPATSTEGAEPARAATTTVLQAFGGPPDADIRADDRLYLDGEDRSLPPTWQVIGEPMDWGSDDYGWTPGQVVTLQRVRG